MTDRVEHVILTRFNIPTPGRESRVRSRPGWLEKRFELFEQFCLPSIAAQTNQNFVWLTYFDSETPPHFKARVEAYRRQHRFFRPRFASLHEMSRLVADIECLFEEKPDWLLTTTLDNDDGLHREFVERLQSQLTFDAPVVLNFERGLVYHHGQLYVRHDSSSPFASFLEPFDRVRTIWGEQHIHLDRLGQVRQLDAPPMWLQVVHDDNVTNRIRGERILRSNALDGFVIRGKEDASENEWDVLLDQAVFSHIRDARESAIKAYKLVRTLIRGDGPI